MIQQPLHVYGDFTVYIKVSAHEGHKDDQADNMPHRYPAAHNSKHPSEYAGQRQADKRQQKKYNEKADLLCARKPSMILYMTPAGIITKL